MSLRQKGVRIAKNTLMLYLRQVLVLLVSLYTVRVVLEVLGVEDYGVYSVVGGIVTLFSFLSGSMASATQRFFSFALGEKDSLKLKKTFAVNWMIYLAIATFSFILLETVGLWFVDQHLSIPQERFASARFVFHFSVVTFVATILTAPFMAIIIAHEDMHIYAYVSVLDVLMKLGVVFMLFYLPWDKLRLYGILVCGVSVLNAIVYISICAYKYSECQFRRFYWDKDLLVEIMNFTIWTLFGQLSTVFRKQAVTILLNQAFNPATVAARAVAVNITSRINTFSNNFNVGLYPPIIKSYASEDRGEMFNLIYNGSKVTFFLNWIFTLPMLLEMDMILGIWLKNPPESAALFTRLALVEVLIVSISSPLATAARAPGKMRLYELTLGSIQIGIFVVSWIVLKLGYPPYSVFVVAILTNLLMFVVRLIIVWSVIGISITSFLRKVMLPVMGVVVFSLIPSIYLHSQLPDRLGFSILTISITIIISSLSMYYIGLNKAWRSKIEGMLKRKVQEVTEIL